LVTYLQFQVAVLSITEITTGCQRPFHLFVLFLIRRICRWGVDRWGNRWDVARGRSWRWRPGETSCHSIDIYKHIHSVTVMLKKRNFGCTNGFSPRSTIRSLWRWWCQSKRRILLFCNLDIQPGFLHFEIQLGLSQSRVPSGLQVSTSTLE
jgi:hypothetical protein